MTSLLTKRFAVHRSALAGSADGGWLRPGQHAVITGGSSGLGLELARQLAGRGLAITLVAQDPHRLSRAREQVAAGAAGARVTTQSVDVSDPEAVEAALDEVRAASGGIDVLINSAGILREGYFERLTHDDFRAVMDVDFFGVVNATMACLPYLKESRGHLVNVSSMAGMLGVFGLTAYAAAKHALNGFTDSLRIEMGPQNVTVQLVCPPEFDSPMVATLDTYRTAENRAIAKSVPPLSVTQVARETIRGIDKREPLTIPGMASRLTWRASRYAPALLDRYFQRRLAAVYRGPMSAGAAR